MQRSRRTRQSLRNTARNFGLPTTPRPDRASSRWSALDAAPASFLPSPAKLDVAR